MIKGIHHISMKCGTAEELTNVRKFYIDILGLKIIREWAEGMMIDTGNGLLEIFTNADGTHCLGAICHMALLTDDYDFEKTYEAVVAWCQKAFARVK